LCYPGSTVTSAARKVSRPGSTDKISISLDRVDLATLRQRARKLYGGNISAAVQEGVRRVREEEGREALALWLGDAGGASPEQRNALRREWKQESRRVPRRRRSRAS
jgi:hypothetical protein